MKCSRRVSCLVFYCLLIGVDSGWCQPSGEYRIALNYAAGKTEVSVAEMDALERRMPEIYSAAAIHIKAYVTEAGPKHSPLELAKARVEKLLDKFEVEVQKGCQLSTEFVPCRETCPGIEIYYSIGTYPVVSYVNEADTLVMHTSGIWAKLPDSFVSEFLRLHIRRLDGYESDAEMEVGHLRDGLPVQHLILEVKGDSFMAPGDVQLYLPLTEELKSQRLEVGMLNAATGLWERASNAQIKTVFGVKCMVIPLNGYGIYALQSRLKGKLSPVTFNAPPQMVFISGHLQTRGPDSKTRGTISDHQQSVSFVFTDEFKTAEWRLILQDVEGKMHTLASAGLQHAVVRALGRSNAKAKVKVQLKRSALIAFNP